MASHADCRAERVRTCLARTPILIFIPLLLRKGRPAGSFFAEDAEGTLVEDFSLNEAGDLQVLNSFFHVPARFLRQALTRWLADLASISNRPIYVFETGKRKEKGPGSPSLTPFNLPN
jgi:hypothetical protein